MQRPDLELLPLEKEPGTVDPAVVALAGTGQKCSRNLKQCIRHALEHKTSDFQQPFEGMAHTLLQVRHGCHRIMLTESWALGHAIYTGTAQPPGSGARSLGRADLSGEMIL